MDMFVTVDLDVWAEFCNAFPNAYAREPDSDTMEHVCNGFTIARVTGYENGKQVYKVNLNAFNHFKVYAYNRDRSEIR